VSRRSSSAIGIRSSMRHRSMRTKREQAGFGRTRPTGFPTSEKIGYAPFPEVIGLCAGPLHNRHRALCTISGCCVSVAYTEHAASRRWSIPCSAPLRPSGARPNGPSSQR
jgi:hypothetical protein